ncbi:MAG: alpha/beta hydrolase [Erythrobacter sp.]|nr:MAG: alpha/beta hydrolase [Erythrobacter sp.]
MRNGMVPAHARRNYPDGLKVGEWRAIDGFKHRCFRLAAASLPRGRLLFLGGRGDFFEKYLEAFGYWAASGWDVSGFDWRGQGGSGLTHPDGYCHVADFATMVDDLAGFADKWRIDDGLSHIALGHSLGGHLLLRALAERRIACDAAVLLAPMLGIRAGVLGAKAVNFFGLVGRVPCLAHRPLWKGQPRSNPGHLTSCPDRHADKLWWKAKHPEIARGGPTWLWLAAAARSMTLLERQLRQNAPGLPVLLLTGARDRVVDAASIARIGALLPGLRPQTIASGGHELLRESNGPRLATLSAIESFLAGYCR